MEQNEHKKIPTATTVHEQDSSPEASSNIQVQSGQFKSSYFEQNAVNPLVLFMNQPMDSDVDCQQHKEALTEDSTNSIINPVGK